MRFIRPVRTITQILALLAALIPASALAQQVAIRVEATIAGATIFVDGQAVRGSGQFIWPVGSTHTLEARTVVQEGETQDVRYMFSQWRENRTLLLPANSPVQRVTVDPAITFYQAIFTRHYKVEMYINSEPLQNLNDPLALNYIPSVSEIERQSLASRYGFLSTNSGGCIYASTWIWLQEQASLTVNAIAYPGKVFTGFDMTSMSNVSSLGSLIVNRPLRIRANFADARRVYFESAPVRGFRVVVNRNTMPTKGSADASCQENGPPPNPEPSHYPFGPVPYWQACAIVPLCSGELDLAPGSPTLLSAVPTQRDAYYNLWVFDHWEYGGQNIGGQNTIFQVPQDYRAYTLTAHFVPGVIAAIQTSPPGLKLKVDSRDNWPSLNFEWGVGQKHQIGAPLEQVDAKGRKYRFLGWSNNGPAEQEIVVPVEAASAGLRLTARYELLGQLTLRSDPSGLPVAIGDSECRTPCTLDKPAGAELMLAPARELPLSPETKLAFSDWSDGARTLSRTYTFSEESATLSVRYQWLHKLTLAADPQSGAVFELSSSPEPGGYFQAGSRLEVRADANPGYRFRRWEGALSGSYASRWIQMNSPAAAVARLDRVPALAENSVGNGAGETPETGVAPGSIISIRGYHLAPAAEMGPQNPLAMTLQGLVVLLDGRILPLVAVSPEEILAQLPSDLTEGEYTLSVKPSGQDAVRGRFQVLRNAPGLFKLQDTEQPVALAFHEDGQPVTPASPARTGETISLLGTGFGPYNPQPLDGFAVPASPPAPLKDPVEVFVGGEPRTPVWCGAAPGRTGYALLKLQVDPSMGPGQYTPVQVRVNGRVSNTVLIPIE